MNPSPEDIRLGKIAALEDLLATAESDIGEFYRDDLTDVQNTCMQAALFVLFMELSQRRVDLICHRNPQPA